MRVCVTIPVFNEENKLQNTITRLHSFLIQHARMDWEIVIANNGSTDQTPAIAESLSREYTNVRAVHFAEKGRGGALKKVWLESDAEILSYMDADLSTELTAFPALIEAISSNGYDLAIGSRLMNPALTTRSFKREFVSRCYNALVRAVLRTKFSDAQCGFKAITRSAARHILPLTEDTRWFFDTELLVLAERRNYRIFDLPVRWVESCDSHVKVIRTAFEDIKGVCRLRRKTQS